MRYILIILILYTYTYHNICHNYISGSCTYSIPYTGNGGSGTCLCINGCVNMFDKCYNNTITDPLKKIYIPDSCNEYIITNDTCDNVYCPIGCKYTNGNCLPMANNILCAPVIGKSCPHKCIYDNNTKSCIPTDAYTVCDLINKTKTCPQNCIYNYNENRCMSSDPNYSCYLEDKLKCPIGCGLNIRGDTCIPNSREIVVQPYVNWTCSTGCTYNYITNRCHSEYNIDCTKIRGYVCPYGLTYRNNYGCVYNIICNKTSVILQNNNNCMMNDKGIYKSVFCEPEVNIQCRGDWPHSTFTSDVGRYGVFTYLLKNEYMYKNIKCKYSGIDECDKYRNITVCWY